MINLGQQKPPQSGLEAHWLSKYNHPVTDAGLIPSKIGDDSRLPVSGGAVSFDGVDDWVDITVNNAVNIKSVQSTFYIKGLWKTGGSILYSNSNTGAQASQEIYLTSTTVVIRYYSGTNRDAYSNYTFTHGISIADNTLIELVIYTEPNIDFTGGYIILNGITVTSFVKSNVGGGYNGVTTLSVTHRLFSRQTSSGDFNADPFILYRIKWFNAHVLSSDIVTNNTSCVFDFKCDEGSGNTLYDSTGNGNHRTMTGSPTRTTQNIYSFSNEEGYTLSSGVRIPKSNTSNFLDVQGNPLQYKGKVSYPAQLVQSSCIQMDTVDDRLRFSSLSGITITSYGGTATLSISGNDILATVTGTVYNLVLSNGNHYPLSEGNGTICYSSNGGQDITLIGGVTRTTQGVYHFNFINKHWEYSNGSLIIRSPIDLTGVEPSGYTLTRVVRGSRYEHNGCETKINFNPYSAPKTSALPTTHTFADIFEYSDFFNSRQGSSESNFILYNSASSEPKYKLIKNFLKKDNEILFPPSIVQATYLTSNSPNFTTTPDNGDLLVWIFGAIQGRTVTPPVGVNTLHSVSSAPTLYVFYKIASSETNSYTFTYSAGGLNPWVGKFRIKNIDAVSPISIIGSNTIASGGNASSVNGTFNKNTLLIAGISHDSSVTGRAITNTTVNSGTASYGAYGYKIYTSDSASQNAVVTWTGAATTNTVLIKINGR